MSLFNAIIKPNYGLNDSLEVFVVVVAAAAVLPIAAEYLASSPNYINYLIDHFIITYFGSCGPISS